MLEELVVRDFAIAEHLMVSLEGGLNLLTGETGAGKSILIGALGFLLGGKADASAIRTGAEETMVSGRFDLSASPEALAWLEARGIAPEAGEVLIRRSLRQNGRGSAYVQGVPVTRGDLAELTALFVDIHGQHDHQMLGETERHRSLLDRYAGLEGQSSAYAALFAELSAKRKAHESMLGAERERTRDAELLRHAVEEIAAARLKEGEEEELEDEAARLSQLERLRELAGGASELLSSHGGEGRGAVELLRTARHALEQASAVDKALAQPASRLDSAFYELEDIASSLRSELARMRDDPARLEACESRLAEIHRLKKKYGATAAEVIAYGADAALKLERIEHWDEDREALQAEIGRLEREVVARAQALSKARNEAGEKLGRAIEAIIKTLGMPKARFIVQVAPRLSEAGKPVYGQFGQDAVEFLIAPNPGEKEKGLAKIASGGELSRVMLAIKTVLASSDSIQTMVFDEVDAGIGGEVALAVGEHLASLAGKKQVLCITHLASIACRAHNHLKVEKRVEAGRTYAGIGRLSGRARTEEIARMLSGDASLEASLRHAEELLARYSGGEGKHG